MEYNRLERWVVKHLSFIIKISTMLLAVLTAYLFYIVLNALITGELHFFDGQIISRKEQSYHYWKYMLFWLLGIVFFLILIVKNIKNNFQ